MDQDELWKHLEDTHLPHRDLVHTDLTYLNHPNQQFGLIQGADDGRIRLVCFVGLEHPSFPFVVI